MKSSMISKVQGTSSPLEKSKSPAKGGQAACGGGSRGCESVIYNPPPSPPCTLAGRGAEPGEAGWVRIGLKK